jgi:hypothetical protein
MTATSAQLAQMPSPKAKNTIRLDIENIGVEIPINDALYANFKNQFWREHPSRRQRNVFTTVMNLMRAAYYAGKAGK